METTAVRELVQVADVRKYFRVKKGFGFSKAWLKAVDGVSFDISPGEILSLVGESGCGKSTLGRIVLNLLRPTGGRVFFEGRDLESLSRDEMRAARERMQIIFQNPYSSLNPRMRIRDILLEPIRTHRPDAARSEMEDTAAALLLKVGMGPDAMSRFPHEFSGGQRQRIGIARAIALNPDLVVCDEPLSALDVSIRSQVINLLCDLKEELGLTYLFISHDLSIVRYLSDRICVMYLGKIVEMGTNEAIFETPLHPYTKSLISSAPIPNPRMRGRERILLEGEIPSPIDPPSGCRFRTRCPIAQAVCAEREPLLEAKRPGFSEREHSAACHFAREKEI